MSQTEFGMIIMTSLVVICSGIALWFSWPQVKTWCQKTSDSSPSSLTLKAPNTGRFFHFKGIDIHFSPAHPLPRELLTLSATLPQ
ncbi:hypothetical protein ACG3QT_00485 [Pseudomonas paraeruginosa]